MKFGHDMHRVVRVSDAEAPYFMQYKLLKKCIKQIRAEPSSPPAAAARRGRGGGREGDHGQERAGGRLLPGLEI